MKTCTHERRLWSAFYEAPNVEWCDVCQRPVYAATGQVLTKRQATKLCREHYEVFIWFTSLGTVLDSERQHPGFCLLQGVGGFCAAMTMPVSRGGAR